MPRRTREENIARVVAQLAGLLLLLCFIHGPTRQAIVSLGALFLAVLFVLVISLAGFCLYKVLSPTGSAAEPLDQPPTALRTYNDSREPKHRPLDQSVVGLGSPSDSRPCQQPAPLPQQADQLIDRLRNIDWFQFEKVIAIVYRKLGYQVLPRGGANPDGGIDLIIEKSNDRVAVQCKHWKAWKVGVRTVRELLGAMTHEGVKRGVLVTVRGYTGEAKALATEHRITILGQEELIPLLRQVDACNDPEVLAVLSDTQKYCPKCEAQMLLRSATRGPGAGRQFWGCSTYPRCRFTMPCEPGNPS